MHFVRVAILAAMCLAPVCAARAQPPAVPLPHMRGTPVELAPDEKGPRRLIRFLTSDLYPPFQFLKTDQSPAGLNVDLARALCTELDFPCTIQALPWDELLPALDSGRADALIAGLRPTPELAGKAELTRPYFRLPARFAARKDAPPEISPAALAGRKVAVVAGSAHEAYLKAFFAQADIAPYADADAARAALKASEVEAVFGDGAGLSLWLGGTGSENCCAFAGGPYFESHFFGEGLVIAVRKGDVRLRQDLDRALDAVEDKGIFADLYLLWFPTGIF